MDSSFVFARSGMVDADAACTAMFVLEGQNQQFALDAGTVDVIGRSKQGYEIQSSSPFREDDKNKPVFINLAPGYANKMVQTGVKLHALKKATGEDGLIGMDKCNTGVYGQSKITKMAPKRFVTEWAGLSPPGRAIKVVLREMNVATKRTILFATGVPPHMGGRIWLAAPSGFGWIDDERYILLDGANDDLKNLSKCNDATDLCFGITNAVPFISGHRSRNRDEQYPRILKYDGVVSADQYHACVSTGVGDIVKGGQVIPHGTAVLQAIVNLSTKNPQATRSGNLVADDVVVVTIDDVDDDMFC